MKRALVLALFGALVLGAPQAHAGLTAQQIRDSRPSWTLGSAGPLCGVYAACSAVRLVGLETEESNYISASYIGTCAGSSVDEICRIVREAGAKAYQRAQLSSYDIRMFGGPVIAYVRKTPSDDQRLNCFTHSETF